MCPFSNSKEEAITVSNSETSTYCLIVEANISKKNVETNTVNHTLAQLTQSEVNNEQIRYDTI